LQSPIDFDKNWEKSEKFIINDRFIHSGKNFLTVKKVKNTYEENIVWINKEDGEYQL